MCIRKVVALVFTLGGCPGVLSAESPESIAEDYFVAMQAEGLSAAPRFMHPDALGEFKSMLLPVFEAEAAAGRSQLRDVTFGPGSTLDAVMKSDPEAFMSSFMNLVITQTGEAQLSFDRLEVLGVVEEEHQRHVLTRMTIRANAIEVSQFEVLSFVPFGDSWRLQLSGRMQGLASALSASIEAGKQQQ